MGVCAFRGRRRDIDRASLLPVVRWQMQCLDEQPPFESSRSIDRSIGTSLNLTRPKSLAHNFRQGPAKQETDDGAARHQQAPQHQEATLQRRNGRPPPAPPARGRPRLQSCTDRAAGTGAKPAAAADVAAGAGAGARAAHGSWRGVGGAGAAPGAERAGGPVSLACASMGFDLPGWLDWLWVVLRSQPLSEACRGT